MLLLETPSGVFVNLWERWSKILVFYVKILKFTGYPQSYLVSWDFGSNLLAVSEKEGFHKSSKCY